MYKFFIATFLIFCVSQDSPIMRWNPDYKIEWSDFKGKPVLQTTTVAVTASGITFSFSSKKSDTRLIDYNYLVRADFYPEQSWYDEARVTPSILNHERLHFDITELFARKFRQRIESTTFNMNISNQMETIHNSINRELETMQNTYDAQTNNSQNRELQKEWETKIKQQLNKLVHYSS